MTEYLVQHTSSNYARAWSSITIPDDQKQDALVVSCDVNGGMHTDTLPNQTAWETVTYLAQHRAEYTVTVVE